MTNGPKAMLCCSFCAMPRAAVSRLYRGTGGCPPWICDRCVTDFAAQEMGARAAQQLADSLPITRKTVSVAISAEGRLA